MLQRTRQLLQLLAQRSRAQQMEGLVHELQMHGAQRQYLGRAVLKGLLLLLNALAHATNHGRVFAAQAAQLQHLFIQITAANQDGTQHLLLQMRHALTHHAAQNALAMGQNALGQQILKQGQTAFLQQCGVAFNLGHQPFLCRQRHDARRINIQNLGALPALAVEQLFDFRAGVQAAPQGVNLVEHHQMRIPFTVAGLQEPFPDRQV